MADQEKKVIGFADLLTAEALVKRQTLHGNPSPELDLLRQAAGITSPEETSTRSAAPALTPENLSSKQPFPDPKTQNLETEYRHLEAQAIELTLAEERLKSSENLSDGARKQLISISRKREFAKKRMNEIERTLTETREITRNAFPPDSILAPETSRARAPQYWRGTSVAETLEPATMIDEETIHSPIPMESPAPSLQEATQHNGKDLAAKLAERAANGEPINPNTILDEGVRARVAEHLNGNAANNSSEAPVSVSVADLEAADVAATEIPAGERVAEDYAEIKAVVDALPPKEPVVKIPVADTERPASRAQDFDEIVEQSAQVPEPTQEEPAPAQNTFETALRTIHDRDPEQANRILNTIEGKDGPIREKFLKAIAATETQREAQVERAKKSLSEKAFGFVKNMGEQYKNLSFGKKVAIGMALTTAVAGGMLLSGATLPVALTAGFTGKRIYGAAMTGMVTAIAVESSRKRYHEKKNGGERTEAEATQDRRRALLMGLLTSGGVLAAGQAISGATQIYEHFSGGGAVNATAVRIAELQKELGVGPGTSSTLYETFANTPEVNAVMAGEAPVASFPGITEPLPLEAVAESAPLENISVTVKSGDNLWNLITEKMDAQGLTANLTPDQKTYFIDSLKDKFADMSPDELKAIGFESGNIDMIRAGDTIDLTKILGDTQFLPDALHNAEVFEGSIAPAGEHVIEQASFVPAAEHPITPEDLPASITETPMSDLPEHPIPQQQTTPENILRNDNGEVVRDNYGNAVRTGEDALLDQSYTREHFSSQELSRLNEAVVTGPEKGLSGALSVVYPPADGEVWAPGEKSASWAAMKGQSAWELMYRPESIDQSVASNPGTPKMRAFIQGLTEYNIQPERSENVESFLKRALTVVAEKSPNKTWSA